MKIIILRAGDAVAQLAERRGEFAELIRDTVAAPEIDWTTIDVRGDAPLPAPGDADAFIVTGSSSSVTERAPWMLRTEAWLRDVSAAEVPTLGICFGHQILAQALGGEVIKNPRGREIGSVEVERLADDPLFDGLGSRFEVSATHVDTVGTVPPGARVLATTALESTAVFAVGDHARGVQFHPELDADAMLSYVHARAERIRGEGLDPEAIAARLRSSEANGRILKNFVRRFASRRRR